jgi:hypothetical protein
MPRISPRFIFYLLGHKYESSVNHLIHNTKVPRRLVLKGHTVLQTDSGLGAEMSVGWAARKCSRNTRTVDDNLSSTRFAATERMSADILQPRAWAISPIACQNGSSSFMLGLCPDSFTDRRRFVESTV